MKDVGSSSALGRIFPIFITPTALYMTMILYKLYAVWLLNLACVRRCKVMGCKYVIVSRTLTILWDKFSSLTQQTISLATHTKAVSVFQLYHDGDMIYEMRKRNPKPTRLATQGISNLPQNIGMIWEELDFDETVSYT